MTQRWKQGYIEKRRSRNGDYWILLYPENGKRKSRRIGLVTDYPTLSAARKAARYIRDEINNPPSPIRRFGDVIARYRAEEMPKRYSTERGYRRMLNLYIEPKWGNCPLEQVKPAAVRGWLLGLEFAPKTKAHLHGMMKLLFTKAQLWEWYDPKAPNPMSFFSITGGSKRERDPNILSPGQFEKLAQEVTREPYHTMLIVDMSLGLRCSELVGLKWEDLDFLEGVIFIRRAVVDGRVDLPKTPQSKARLPMGKKLAEVLLSYRRSLPIPPEPEDWVFPSITDSKKPILPDNIVQHHISPAAARVGLPFPVGWHTLRHTYKAWMDGLCPDPATKMHLMRHSDIRTTENVYGGPQMQKMRDVNDKVLELVSAGGKQ